MYLYKYEYLACKYVCVPQAHLVPKEVRRRHQITWDRSYSESPWFFERAVNTLNH